MRTIRPLFPALVVHTLLFAVLLLAAACDKNQRAKTIHATLVSIDAARDGFTAWDRQHQQTLVEHAVTREDAVAAVASYREKRQVVLDGFELAYRALAVAATQTDEPSLKAALAQAAKLAEAILKLRGP